MTVLNNTNLHGAVIVDNDGELKSTTPIIARGLKQTHNSVIKLVKKYQAELESFGSVRFQLQDFDTRGGSQTREIALLNEHQCALLGSLMRNNPTVVAFKVALVKEFYRMREQLSQQSKSLWHQLQAALAKEAESAVRASFGSRLMLQRKRELPLFVEEIGELEAKIQPSLLN